MSKVNEMFEELINAIETLELIEEEDFAWYIDKDIAQSRLKAIQTIINYIENSIPKEVIEKKKTELKTKLIERQKLGWFDANLEGRVQILQELLEGK